ncbi:MAG: hypothetical protein H7842_15305, partial [Gammaproteobacteria bacterium SHHR-1]
VAVTQLFPADKGDWAPASILGPYAYSQTRDSHFSLPSKGSAEFNLSRGEAHIYNEANNNLQPGSIESGRLSVDFVERRFDTGLDIQANGQAYEIQARGTVLKDGSLRSELFESNATVIGGLGGLEGETAGYIFRRQIGPDTSLVGGTSWQKH